MEPVLTKRMLGATGPHVYTEGGWGEVLAEWHLGIFPPFLRNQHEFKIMTLGWLVIAIWRDLFSLFNLARRNWI